MKHSILIGTLTGLMLLGAHADENAGMPAPSSLPGGRQQLAIVMDEAEAARWQIKGDLQVKAENGRLVFTGRGNAKREFEVDLAEFPALVVHVSRANTIFNMGLTVANQQRQVFLRTDQPRRLEDVVPVTDRATLTGKTKVTLDIIGGPYEISELAFLAPTPTLGPPAPAGAEELNAPGQATDADRAKAFHLASGDTGLAVWKQTGCLAAGWDLSTGQRVMKYSGDVYRFLPQQGDGRVAFEADDKVVKSSASADGKQIDFECTNAAFPGVRILKRYSVHPTPGVIAKRVEFRADKDWNGLIYWESVVNLDPQFRRGGQYNNPDYHPRDFAFFNADDIVTETKQPYRQQVIFYNPRAERTVGHHRMLIDDKPIGPQVFIPEHEKDRAHFTPAGWRFFALADRLWDQKNPSATVHYTILPGDMIAYHRQYMSLPEFQAGNHIAARPAWLNEVKGEGLPPNLGRAELRAWNDLLLEGYGIRILGPEFHISDYHTTGEWHADWAGGQRDQVVSNSAVKVRNQLKFLREAAPRLKLSVYTFYWSVSQDSQVFKEHPEWFHRLRNGQYKIEALNMPERFLTPEHVAWLNDRTRAIMRDFDFDFFYLDGGGFGEVQVDWPTMRVIQPTDSFLELSRNLAVSSDRPAFVNAGNGLYGWHNPMGFYEGFIPVTDWRAMSIKLMELKLYQQPGTFVMPIHWYDSDARRYSNYCTLLGLKGKVDIARKYLPLVNMNYELHPLTIQEVGLRPRWYAAEKGDLETYALGFDRRHLLISLLNHKKTDQEYAVSFDPAKTQMDPARETYVYRLQPEGPVMFLYNQLSEPEDQQLYRDTGWAASALPARSAVQTFPNLAAAAKHNLTIRADHTEHLVVTQTPGLIWSVDSRRKYFPLPHTRWGEVAGQRDSTAVHLKVNCTQPCEVAALLPADWTRVSATVDGRPVAHRMVIPDLALVAVPAGQHEVVVRREAGPAGITLAGGRLDVPAEIFAGQSLALTVTFGQALPAATKFFLNISRDAAPIYTSAAVDVSPGATELRQTIALPDQLPPGNYLVRVSAEGTADSLTQPVKIGLPRLAYPAGWDDPAQRRVEVKEINRDYFGFQVLRSFRETSGSGTTVVANASPDASAIDVNTGDGHIAGAAGAAVEYASVRLLHANVSFLPPPDRESFDAEPDAQLGFTVDFHTPQGYAKRVYFNASKPNARFTATNGPAWGTNSKDAAPQVEHQHVDWRRSYLHAGTVTWPKWDLLEYAPADWDGRAILGAYLHAINPPTRLFFRLRPQTKFMNAAYFIDPSLLGERVGWKTGTYRTVKPATTGDNATASFDEKSLTLKAKTASADSHAAARLLCEETFVITAKAAGRGDTALVADYVSPEGIAKRLVCVVSGDPAAVGAKVKALPLFAEFTGPVEVVDFRKQFDNGLSSFVIPLGTHAPSPAWENDWGKKLLLSAVAVGASAEISVQLIDMDSFRRF